MRAPASIAMFFTLIVSGTSLGQLAPSPRFRPHTDPRRAERIKSILHGSPDSGAIVDGESFWWIGATSTNAAGTTASAVPNSGVQAVIQSVNFGPDGGCFDCWTSDILDNNMWGQVGFATCGYGAGNPSDFTTFYQVWNLDLDPQADGTLLVDGESTVATTGLHTYAMNVQSGTVWQFSVDGNVFGTYDMGITTASAPGAVAMLCEEGDGVTAAFVPPAVSIPTAMSIFNEGSGGSWAGALTSWSYNSAGLSGVAGNAQDSSLPDDALSLGGNVPFADGGEVLWDGTSTQGAGDAGANGNAPPLVLLVAPVANANVSGSVTLTATVTVQDGGPAIANVTFALFDQFGIYSDEIPVNAPPYTTSWDSTQVPNEPIYLYATATDVFGNQSWVDTTLNVVNATTSTTGTTTASTTSSSGTAASTTAASSTSSSTSSSGSSSGTATASTSSTGSTTSTPSTSGTTGKASATAGSSTGGMAAASASSSTSGAVAAAAASSSTGAASASTTTGSSSGSGGCGTGSGTSSPLMLMPALALMGWLRRRRAGGASRK